MLLHLLRRPRRGEQGATAVEYALMVSGIAIVIIAGVALFGSNASELFRIPAGVFAP